MGKCIAYVAAAVVFMGLGALVAGICVWYLAPLEKKANVQTVRETRYAACDMDGSGITGTVLFEHASSNSKTPLIITGNLTGIPLGLHGFHIHMWGIPYDADCVKAGGHYNPMGLQHGAPDSAERHVGDLGNINVTEEVTELQITDYVASLWGDKSIMGRSIVLHAGEDDLGLNDDQGSKTTGNAGARLACCTIYLVTE